MNSTRFTPDWDRMGECLKACEPSQLGPFDQQKLLTLVDLCRQNWKTLLENSREDSEANVHYLRRDPEKVGSPPYTCVFTNNHIYVVKKGDKTERVGKGAFKRYADALDLSTAKQCVLGSMDLKKCGRATVKEKREMIRAESIANRSLGESSYFPQLITIFNVPSKLNDFDKVYFLYEKCGPELFAAVAGTDELYSDRLQDPLANMLHVLHDILAAAKELEKAEIVHRDIRLENFFMVERGNGILGVKLGDLGCALSLKELKDRLVHGTLSLETGSWVCPHLRSISKIDPSKEEIERVCSSKTDVWAVGELFFTLLTKVNLQENQKQLLEFKSQADCDRVVNRWLTQANKGTPRCLKNDNDTYSKLVAFTQKMLKIRVEERPLASELYQEFMGMFQARM